MEEASERAELLCLLAALGAAPEQIERAAGLVLVDLREIVRWWISLLPSTRTIAD
jgi:hypothetical protein